MVIPLFCSLMAAMPGLVPRLSFFIQRPVFLEIP